MKELILKLEPTREGTEMPKCVGIYDNRDLIQELTVGMLVKMEEAGFLDYDTLNLLAPILQEQQKERVITDANDKSTGNSEESGTIRQTPSSDSSPSTTERNKR